jgi:HlyD family secretion protein
MFPVDIARPRPWAALAGLLVLAVALAVLAWHRSVASVEVVTLQPAPLVSTLQLSARVAAPNRVELGSTITGRVRSVAVRAGDSVSAGQPLLALEADELGAVLDQAVAAERSTEARLQGLRSSGRAALQAGVAQAEAQLVAARADLARQQALVAQGFVSPARLDEARRALGVAEAQRDSAAAQRQAGDEAGGADIAQAAALLAQARAATQAARRRLDQATLRSPAAGRVISREAEPGQIVQPGRVLLTLAPAGDTELVAALDERYLGRLRAGQPARVRADAYPQRVFSATVRQIAPLVDAQRGSVEIRLLPVPPVPDFLREDMTLSVEVETGRRDRALVLPLAALRGDPADEDRSTVWVVAADGRLAVRSVTLGLRTLREAELLQGLEAGEAVVVLAGDARPGDKVRVRPAQAGTDGSPEAAPGSRRSAGGGAGAALGNAMGR